MRSELPGDYRGSLAHTDLGGAQFVEMTALPLHVWRTPELIRRSDPGLYKIEMHTRGHSVLAQGDRQSILRAGDIALVDTSRPYRMSAGYPRRPSASSRPTVPSQLLTLTVPRPMLPLPDRSTSAVAGLDLSDRLSTGELMAAALRQLAHRARLGDEETAPRLAAVVIELLAIGLADESDPVRTLASGAHQETLLWRIQEFIEHHLGDSDLSPATVAEAHHVSLRYLHRLFEAHGLTVAELIRTRRLDRCRRELSDPACRDRSVAAVGARWGFGSAAHFSRAFRRAYGTPPATFRTRRLAEGSDA